MLICECVNLSVKLVNGVFASIFNCANLFCQIWGVVGRIGFLSKICKQTATCKLMHCCSLTIGVFSKSSLADIFILTAHLTWCCYLGMMHTVFWLDRWRNNSRRIWCKLYFFIFIGFCVCFLFLSLEGGCKSC